MSSSSWNSPSRMLRDETLQARRLMSSAISYCAQELLLQLLIIPLFFQTFAGPSVNLQQGDLYSGEEHYNEYLIGQIASSFSGDSVWFRAMEANLQACFVLVRANKRSEPWDRGCRILSSAWSERPPGSWWTPPAWSGSASRCRPPRPVERFPAETPGSDWYGSWSRRDEGQKG